MKKKRISAFFLTIALLSGSLSSTAYAATWYMEDGDVIVSASESGQTVSQNNNTIGDNDPTFTNRDSSVASDSTITINMVQDDMKALYWQGPFNPKLPNSEDTTITSTADTKALEGSVLASLDATKVFRFTKGEVEQLSFDYGFMGVTQPVYLGRV